MYKRDGTVDLLLKTGHLIWAEPIRWWQFVLITCSTKPPFWFWFCHFHCNYRRLQLEYENPSLVVIEYGVFWLFSRIFLFLHVDPFCFNLQALCFILMGLVPIEFLLCSFFFWWIWSLGPVLFFFFLYKTFGLINMFSLDLHLYFPVSLC